MIETTLKKKLDLLQVPSKISETPFKTKYHFMAHVLKQSQIFF